MSFLHEANEPLTFGAVILAAGMSKRMGKPKLLLPLNHKPLFLYPVETAVSVGLKPIVVITGKYDKEIKKSLSSFPHIMTMKNDQYESGMSTSLKLGIDYLEDMVDAAFVFLSDQPFVTREVILKMIGEFRIYSELGYRVVRPVFNGKEGHPILFHADLFAEFKHLQGDSGGKGILKQHEQLIRRVPFQDLIWGFDIDTPVDYQYALEQVINLNR